MSDDGGIFLPESYGDVLVDVPQPAHAILGASSCERWTECPGSVAMSKGMPNKSSIYAMEGTAAHHLGELCLKQDLSADIFLGQFMTYGGELLEDAPELEEGKPTIVLEGHVMDAVDPAFPINDDMVKAVNKYLETVEYYVDWARKTFGVEPIVLTEERFDLSSVYHDMFGTNDCCIWVPGKCLIVIDYKHGRGKTVEIGRNHQLRYYGLGALLKLCTDKTMIPQEVVTVIVQPRAAHKDGPVRDATYPTREIVIDFRNELIAAAKRTEMKDAELKTGDWCFFCAGKPKCPKITGKFAKLSGVDMYDLSDDELNDESAIVNKIVQNVINNPELMNRFLTFAPIMESTIEAIREFALKQALEGQVFDDHKLVPRETKRKYADETLAAQDLLAGGLSAKDIYELKLKSQTKLKKLGKEKWTKVEKILKDGEHVIKPEGALTLARRDDARTEHIVAPFGDLTAADMAIEPPDFDIL